jgi:hypothetical protein
MFNPFSKTSWIEHVLEGYVGHALQRTALTKETQGWIVTTVRAFVFAVLAGGITVHATGGRILWTPTVATFVLLFIRTAQQSPMPREVWTDVQRIAEQELFWMQEELKKKVETVDDAAKPAEHFQSEDKKEL